MTCCTLSLLLVKRDRSFSVVSICSFILEEEKNGRIIPKHWTQRANYAVNFREEVSYLAAIFYVIYRIVTFFLICLCASWDNNLWNLAKLGSHSLHSPGPRHRSVRVS